MKKFLLFLLIVIFAPVVFAQTTQSKTDKNGYTYSVTENDPLQARIYTLENGLTIYLSVYKDAPRIQTYIAVRAGSKNDPANATGLAHYLEHMLFKGTSTIGTMNWEKEQAELKKIEQLYEVYRRTTDTLERTKLYHQIDSISVVASKYSIANEYDKMLSNIGASGTNAYTFVEQTVYVNDIPSNQIEKWAIIEAERFSMVAPRLFHTELEAVYEEKNKGMDQDSRKVWEIMLEGLFPTHPYGTQTTIGTVDHLKNPSITEILKYFNTHYCAGNMAVCMSGDFDPDSMMVILDRNFGKLQYCPIKAELTVPKGMQPSPPPVTYIPVIEKPIQNIIKKEVVGPDAENVMLAFRMRPEETLPPGSPNIVQEPAPKAYHYFKLLSMILNNGQAGLIDLNLNQNQKILGGFVYDLPLNEYSILMLGGKPREGQTLEEVEALLISQIELVRKGEFPDWLIPAVLNDYKMNKMKDYESNRNRADAFVEAFISKRYWEDYIHDLNYMQSISKQDLIAFAQKYLNNNYVVVYKRKGVDTSIQKVPKPKISPVELNRDAQSDFYKKVMGMNSPVIEPVYINFQKDLSHLYTANKTEVLYKQNNENGLFVQQYLWDFGKEQNPAYAIAGAYFNYLGTDKFTPEQIKEEFYKLGSSYSVSVSNDNIVFTISGLDENYHATVRLFDDLLSELQADTLALNNMIDGILKSRKDNKLSKDAIRGALVYYAKYGSHSPFTHILSEKELRALKPEDLIKTLQSLTKIKHRIIYYGPHTGDGVTSILDRRANVPSKMKALKTKSQFTFQPITENKVYWVDYNMVQAEIVILSKSVNYTTTLIPQTVLFNEYFGGGMGSLVFTELRESRALAYSVRSRYESATKLNEPNYENSYIGTQADKIFEAMDGMIGLLDTMPRSQVLFDNSKASVIEMLRTQRITKSGVISEYIRLEKLGLKNDVRKEAFEKISVMTYEDLKNFQQTYVKGQKHVVLVVGSKDKIDFNALSKYGKVQELTLEQIFGY